MNVSIGLDCRNKNHLLQTKELSEVFRWIQSSADPGLLEQTRQLRSVLQFSKDRYREMKTRLPFFCCSIFEPAQRSVHQFKRASGLILDFDFHDKIPEGLLPSLQMEPRIALGYISPSNQGVKLVFEFSEVLTDVNQYTNVYKAFSRSFSQEYGILTYLDTRNSDVSRISFVCHDPNAWFNAIPVHISVQEWLEDDGLNFAIEPQNNQKEESIDPHSYKEILRILQSKPKTMKPERTLMPVFQERLPHLTQALTEYQIQMTEVEAIQYGMKIKARKGSENGEINVYYGKRGFQVVTSPRRGTHDELNNVIKIIAEGVFTIYFIK